MFSGFPAEGIAFLKSLERNNNREWFQPRKERFEATVRQPMIELVEVINKAFLDFAPDHITDPKKAVYRIYRDTRFSTDKTPYKTHIAAVFPRHGLDRHSSAGYYFQISPKGVGLAAGAYMPGPEQLFAIRTWLTENYELFVAASRKVEKVFGKMHEGAALARSPKGFDPNHPAAALIRKRNWFYWTEPDIELATSPKLAPEIVRHFRAVAPVMDLLNGPLLKKPRATSL
jgi:uncharacterized protein (TIGR02453 family)